MWRGDLARARELVETSHEIHERGDDWCRKAWGQAQTTGTLGAIARDTGDDETARELLRESADLAGGVGVEMWQGWMLLELAALSLRARRVDEAEDAATRALEIAVGLRDRPSQVFGVGLLACVAAERGELERAGRLWGAIEDERTFAPLGGWQLHRDDCYARLQRLENAQFEAGLAEGRKLELDAAAEEGLGR
jgi:ATP/maltotriose-dependent transcriptional regulator MalT